MDAKLDTNLLSPEATRLRDHLRRKIISQDRAIDQLVLTFQNFRSGLNPPGRPLGVLLFAGPTGVGKTEVVRQLCEFLFGNPDAMLKIDCAEFQKEHYVARLIGSPHGYTGFGDSPQITQEKLDKYSTEVMPISVLLFDELEQAHQALYDLLLGVFDSGKLTLGNAHEVDLTKTLIVITSNLGASDVKREIEAMGIGFQTDHPAHEKLDKRIHKISLDALKRHFRPQFMNRLDRVVVFGSLPGAAYQKILSLRLEELQNRLTKCSVPVVLDVTKSVRKFILDECNVRSYGGRELNRSLRKYLIAPLSNLIGSNQLETGDKVTVTHGNGKNLIFKRFPGAVVLPISPKAESSSPEPSQSDSDSCIDPITREMTRRLPQHFDPYVLRGGC
jgi:ATP-dependent Clp protease ATP-binding subunit ClpB